MRDRRAPAASNAAAIAVLHRRRQRVVVRAPGKSMSPGDEPVDRRERLPTLSGLGYRAPADTQPVLFVFDLDADETTPVSRIRTRVEPRESVTPTSAPSARTDVPEYPDTLLSLEDRDAPALSSIHLKVEPLPFIEFPALTDDDVVYLGDEEETPLSCVRLKVTEVQPVAMMLPPRGRPATLLDGVDDDLARRYREEAERILKSGFFDVASGDYE
jgi:hypothetical protein